MRLLTIETSGSGGSVALAVDGDVTVSEIQETRQQTSLLLPMIDELLEAAELAVTDLDAIGFGHGPGSFTGLRVAAAIAQGLSLPTDVPLVSVPSMAAMLQGVFRAHQSRVALVCIDARMDEVYRGHYEIQDGLAQALRPDAIGAPEIVGAPEQRPYLCLGDGFHRYKGEFADLIGESECCLPDCQAHARDLVPLAAALANARSFVEPAAALPIYLRDSSAWRRQ